IAHTMSETIAQNRVFIYEPHLVSQIAQLVSYDNSVPVDIQTYALYALDGIARHRTKVTEVLAAFNASANHGVLLHILRQLCQSTSAYTVDFLDALFTLLTFLLQTSAGGTMLMSAGIMSTLIQVLDHPSNGNPIYRKAFIKVIGLLDTIMSNINTSFSSFCSANGLDVLLRVIQTQVDECIASNQQPPNYDALTLTKNALRFLIRMMESSDTADGLRNLIESSIPHTIMKVMEHHRIFGPSVFALVINVATTFIHNEPTSLSVLQELGLPQTFLKTFKTYDQPNFEVLMASVHSFGAICLNSAGLDMFDQAAPLPHFFSLMTAPSFVTNASDVGNATALGTTMDELIRHHPKLKFEVFKCTNQLLQQVDAIGRSERGKPLDDCHELVYQRRTDDPSTERAECLLLGFVDLVARFLEGFLRNVDNVKEFVKYGGPELLLSYYSLPMLPYDFSVSNAFDSLGFVFRVIADVSPNALAKLIAAKVFESSRFIFNELPNDRSLVYEYIEANGKDEASQKAGNDLFKKFSILFGYIGLLSTIFSSAILTSNKFAGRLVEWCIEKSPHDKNVIQMLGDIHRCMVWQNIMLRDAVPKSWYSTNAQGASSEQADLKDPRVINVRRFKLLLSEVPPALMPVLQGIIKVSTNRRIPTAAGSSLSFPERAKLVAAQVADLFSTSLHYMFDADSQMPDCKYDYYSSMFSMISMLLLDDRSRTALETPIAVAFEKAGVIDFLLQDMLPRFWESAETKIKANVQDDALAQRINTCIELLLAILHHLGSSKLFFNSPHTNILTQVSPEDAYTTLPELLDPYHWMASMQLKLTGLYKYLSSPLLAKFSRHVLHSLLRCVTQNMKQEGEKRSRAARKTGPPQLNILPELQSSNPLTSTEFDAGVRILINMWYDPALATEALRENNNLAQAAMALARYRPSALRTPSSSSSAQPDAVVVEDDNDDEYEDIASEDEEGEADESMYTTEEEDQEEEHDEGDATGQHEQVLQQLQHNRNEMRAHIPQILSRLVDQRSDLDFEVRGLMAMLCCGDPAHWDVNTKETVRLFFGDQATGQQPSQDALATFASSLNKIRIFALMLREPSMQDVMALLITTMSDYMSWFEFLDMIVAHPEFPDPQWLTTLFLILEAALAQSDEPKEATQSQDYEPAIVTPENRTTLMKYCIDLLKMDSLTEDNLVSVLRIIVRLTKHHAAALQFVALGGLVPLFKRPSSEFKALKIQQAYIIMILRHMMESKQVLTATMREWLVTFFTNNARSDAVDVDSFLRNHSNLVLRDPDVFVHVSTQLCRLGNTPKSMRYVGIKEKEGEEEEKQEEEASSVDTSSLVIHFLLSQLVQTQAQDTESNIKLAYTGFLLQCIFELVSSYPSCKSDIINFEAATASADTRVRQSILFKLTNTLLPYNAIQTCTDQDRKKQGVSMWVASLLVGMCYDTTPVQKKDKEAHRETLAGVRNHVLDVVAQSLQDTLHSHATASVKYNRYFALTELCHRILNARPTGISVDTSTKEEDAVKQVSKLMLDKHFVPILISVISDVDVNYPQAKSILNSILRPLEQLTKSAIRIHLHQQNDGDVEEEDDDDDDDQDMYIPMDTDEEDTEADQVNDLYRNSSLAMFDGAALEEESSEEEASDDDISMASDSSGLEIDLDSDASSMEENDQDVVGTDSESESDTDSFSSNEYDSSNESLNSDRSDSIHSNDSRDLAWQLTEDGRLNGHGRRRRRDSSLVSVLACIVDDNDDDDMDIDPADYELDTDGLNAEELEDVERNRKLAVILLAKIEGNGFHGNRIISGTNRSLTATRIINPTVRGSLNNNSGDGNGAGRPFDNVILHPLLRGTPSHTTDAPADASSLSAETAILCGANSNHLQAYEDIIGGSAVRILENLFSQQRQRNNNDEPTPSGTAATSTPTETTATNDAETQQGKETLDLLKEFQPCHTTDRWTQEAHMVYIPAVASAKATQLTNRIVTELKERQKDEPETEQDQHATEESPEMQDMFSNAASSDNDSEIEVQIQVEEDQDIEDEDEEDPLAAGDDEQDRVVVMIHGEEVDITGTGIDVEFLEALPDDLRAEVISQQMAERRPSIESMDQDEISPEFLAALPPDIRNEVLRQESMDRSRRQARDFLDTQDMESTPADSNTSNNTPNIAVNTTELEGDQHHVSGPHTKPSNHSKDAIRIVDKSQLATLARLVFVPQSISKALLNRLLLSLCENSKTRSDLLSLLVCILQDGSTDLAAVDQSFMDLSIHKSTTATTNKPLKTAHEPVHAAVSAPAEHVPNLIAHRCLEILYHVVNLNDRSLAYFLTEHDSLSYLKRRHSTEGHSGRKSKTTNKALIHHATHVKYPILVLIGLLDRPVFMENVTLMEQLMDLLQVMCLPIPNLVSNYNKKTKSDIATTTSRRAPPQPPLIPFEYIQKIVDVLSMGECSSRTFRSTINVLSRLSPLDGAMDAIIEGLTSIANACGQQIIVDLQQLYLILDQLKAGAELEGSALAQFSAATSHQARLLRVLKAMDYLYTRNNKRTDHAEQNEKAVLKIYDNLDFLPLWTKLGACLSLIQEREDLLNVASVLLPLVESFMAVSKYVNHKGYTRTETANPADEFFLSFTEEHKKILNIMVRNNPSLMSGSFALLIHNPKILEFDNKRNYFVQQLHKRSNRREQYPSLRLSLDRANVFEDTYRKLQGLTGDEIKYGKLNVHFHGEEGVDAGGVAREWFSVLARQMFDPNYALFITSAADKLTYQPNRASGVNSEHLSYFKCVGRIIGKAIHDGRLLDAYFTRSFYKLMLGRSVDYRDVEAVDPAYYKSLVWMLENDITDIIDLTFSVETDDFGTNKIIDLKPDGRNIPVTEENKHEYVTLVTEQKLVLAIKDQVNAFLEGFHDIIPASLIQIFNEQELELLISGLPDIDIDEWKANTVYEGYTLSSPQIQWFWRAVRSFDQEERAKLLQFSTGTSKVPLEGFAELQGSNGVQKFQIHKEFGDVNRLPSAHTCFNQIDLPQYLTYEDLRANLFKAISECSTGFAFQ
ncbi:hypothetical protein FB192DRAFT_1285399, partial [Mucor lusitanicus]